MFSKISSYSHHHYLFLLTLVFFIGIFIFLMQKDDLKIPQENVTIQIDITDKINNLR
jgi:hypothetical protein